MAASTRKQIFINCPFDPEYRPIFDAIVFAVLHCGFEPRSALDAPGSGQARFERLLTLIGGCRLAIHDLSRVEPNHRGLPRFNMPFELGLFVGARHFGGPEHRRKDFLILEGGKGQCRKTCSDLGGADPLPHNGRPAKAVKHVRDWLGGHTAGSLQGEEAIQDDFSSFRADLPGLLARLSIKGSKVSFLDFRKAGKEWLAARPLP